MLRTNIKVLSLHILKSILPLQIQYTIPISIHIMSEIDILIHFIYIAPCIMKEVDHIYHTCFTCAALNYLFFPFTLQSLFPLHQSDDGIFHLVPMPSAFCTKEWG